ncbi:TPA: sensor histidine kinase [Vibrio parahaemolyticus]|nr:sensor histidine kinase [Vibrio parahaemolyticus]
MARFQVLARTLVHLGSELITSDSIAIYELIKNAIDARSPDVKVIFTINFEQNILNSLYHKWLKYDDDWKETIENDLLHIIENECLVGELSPEEKQLVQVILDSSSVKDAAEHLLKFNYIKIVDAGCGMSKGDLENIFLTLGTDNKLNKEIEGQPYLGNKGIGRISMMRLGHCSEVSSWKDDKSAHQIKFDWRLFECPNKFIDEIPISAENFCVPNNSTSGTIIKITHLKHMWTREEINTSLIDGFLRKLRNPFDKEKYKFPIHVYLNGTKEKNRLPIKELDKDLWNLAQRTVVMKLNPTDEHYLKITIKDEKNKDRTLPFTSTNEMLLHELDCTDNEIRSIGRLNLRIKWFNRRVLVSDIKDQGLSSRSKDLRNELDLWSGGIAIYRDGFRIGNSGDFDDKDWFDIDKGALRGQGFTLNRIQIIGALEITNKENKKLHDRSNREGLIENVQMRILKKIINSIVLTLLRETINQDKDNPDKTPKELSELVKKNINNSSEKLSGIRKNISSIIKNVDADKRKVLKHVNEDLHIVSNQIKDLERMSYQLKEQREDILELAGAGTLTHVVMHELARTTGQTKDLINQVAKESSPKVNKLLRKLEQEIKSINARIRQFDPHSISGRNNKVDFDLVDYIKTILSGYEKKSIRHNIKIKILVDGEEEYKPFKIKMVKGFVAIAIENLITNSFYWLKQNEQFKPYIISEIKEIIIDIDTFSKTISVWDSGVGIASCDKERIFIPGYTTKKSQRDGKGFGLFIAKEISKSAGGDLYLDTEEDKNKRLRRFIIELPKE